MSTERWWGGEWTVHFRGEPFCGPRTPEFDRILAQLDAGEIEAAKELAARAEVVGG